MAEEDKFDDIFDGHMFDDWAGLKPGYIINPFVSRLRYRQGADTESWASCGGSKYLPHGWQMATKVMAAMLCRLKEHLMIPEGNW